MNAIEELQARDLAQRLAEAEATIEALLSGQVDAVVDSKSHTPVLLAKAQRALRDERDRAQRFLDTPDVILLARDLDGRITLVNRYACQVLGWPAAALLDRDWIETCLPARNRDEGRQEFQRLIGGDLAVVENVVLTRSGEERLIGWRSTVLRDGDGRVIGTFSSGADITDRKQAAAALEVSLRESRSLAETLRIAEERMRFALAAADVGVWDMDVPTGAVRWSEGLEAHYGLLPGAFGGTFAAFIECIHPDDRKAVLETMASAGKSGDEFSIVNRSIWPDGTSRWLNGAGRFHLDEHGVPLRAFGISQDVTERHTLEAQYLQAQKMEAIGRLAGGVAHDFNNLLTVILGFCELLLADRDKNDPRRADTLEIQKAATRAAELTRQLLAYSRKQIIEPARLDLNVVVTGMHLMLGRLIGEDVTIALRMRPGLGAIQADRGQVEQVVLNLAVNARDAMPKGGTLTLETANVVLDEHYAAAHLGVNPGHYVSLTLSDTGVGMTPQVQARLFEPFFTTKKVGEGTGLGLATVHGIVTRSGGTVSVYSEVGKGSTFRAYFPRDDTAETVVAAPAPAPAGRPSSGAETVLVVEDADGLRALVGKVLRRQGYTVLAAANAAEAGQMFDDNPSIAVLLTDVVMPGASGPELTAQLIKRRPSLRVIYMSGYTEDAIVHHGVLDQGITFIHKPFTAEALGAKIREVLDR